MIIDLNNNCNNLNFNFFKAFYINTTASRGVSSICPATLLPSDAPGNYTGYEANARSIGKSLSSSSNCCGEYPNQTVLSTVSTWENLCNRTSTYTALDRVDKYGNYQTKITATTTHAISSSNSSGGGCGGGNNCSSSWNYRILLETDTEFPDEAIYEATCNVTPPCQGSSGQPAPSTPSQANPCGGATLGGVGCVNTIRDMTCDSVIYGDHEGSSDSQTFSLKCPCFVTPFGTCLGPDVPYEATDSLMRTSNGQERWLNKRTLDEELGLARRSVAIKENIYKNNLPQDSQGTKCGNGLPTDCWSSAWIGGTDIPSSFQLQYKYNSLVKPTIGWINKLSIISVVSTSIKEDAQWKKFKNVNGKFFVYRKSSSEKTPCNCGVNSIAEFLVDGGMILGSIDFNFTPKFVSDSFKTGWATLQQPLSVENDAYLGVGCNNPRDLFCNPQGTSYIFPKEFSWCYKVLNVAL